MSSVYERAEIYDLLENKERTEIIRNDWKEFLGQRKIKTLLDVSIGTGSMTQMKSSTYVIRSLVYMDCQTEYRAISGICPAGEI